MQHLCLKLWTGSSSIIASCGIREIDTHTTSSAFVSFDVVGIVIADTVGIAAHQVVPDLLPVCLSGAATDGVLPFQQLLPRGPELRSRVTRTGSYCIAQPLRYVDRYYRCPQVRSMEVGRREAMLLGDHPMHTSYQVVPRHGL